jgi:hypothetical protein
VGRRWDPYRDSKQTRKLRRLEQDRERSLTKAEPPVGDGRPVTWDAKARAYGEYLERTIEQATERREAWLKAKQEKERSGEV